MSEGGKRKKRAAMLLSHSNNEKIIKYISSSHRFVFFPSLY